MRRTSTSPLSAPGRLTAGLLAFLLCTSPLPAQTGLPTVALLNETAQAGDQAGKKSLHEALQEINRVRGVFFMYDEQLLNGKHVNELSDFSGSLDRVLHRLLRNTGLQYKKIKNDTYVITPEKNAGDTGQHSGRALFEGVASLPSQLPPATAALVRVNLTLPVGKTVEKRITGRVTSAADQAPLPGVSVLVKGTTVGTATDAEGNYTLNAPDNAAVLVFSFIGYTTEEVPLNGRTTVDMVLVPDVLALSEVVVVGYGERKKTTYTGSVAAIDNSEIVRAPVADISNNLVGRLPGVIATQRTGEPGQDGSNITIRGISTTGSNAPLIVIDGIPRPDYGFSQIDPNEIENISILKDAAAAAVFGVRGANGVILVTTKRGKSGKPQFSFSTRTDFQVPTRLPQFLDSYNTAILYNEGLRNEGKPELYSPDELEAYRNGSNPDVYPNTDWFDITLKPYAPQSQHNLNVSGGTDRARYFLSAGYLSQKGLYENLHFRRYNFRSNIDVDVTKTTTVSFDLTGRLEDREFPGIGAQNIFDALMRNQPLAVGYYSNGLPGIGRSGNPAEAVKKAGYSDSTRNVFLSQLSITQQLPFLPGLSVMGRLAYDRSYQTRKNWRTPFPTYEFNPNTGEYKENLAGVPTLEEHFGQNQNLTSEVHLNYTRTFGLHSLNGLVLYTQTSYQSNYLRGRRTNYISTALDVLNAGGADNQPPLEGASDERARRGVVGRVSYDFGSKYLFEANFRYDGSENFPQDQRWGFFPSVSAGWRVSEEAFFQNALPFVENFKIRASVGQLGNDVLLDEFNNPQRFAYLGAFVFGDPYVFDGAVVQTIREGRLPNANITWEKATSSNVGIETSLWNGKLSFEADFFYKRTQDILGRRVLAIPAASGITRLPFENLDKVDNRGVELVLGHTHKVADVTYYVRGNLTYARNKIVYRAEPEDIDPNIRQTGRPINQYFGLKAEGLFQSQEEITNAPDQGPGVQPGDIRYADVNGDNKIDDKDRVAIGRSPIPELIYGLTFGGSYRGFDLNVLWQGAGRVSAYLSNESAWAFFNSGKALEQHLDRWTPDNPDATYPRMSTEPTGNNTRTSSYWLRNAAYLRLKNVEVGYTLPTAWSTRLGIGSVRLYAVGQNLLTFDQLEVLDPEGPGASGNAGRGWFYPQQKVYSMGLNVNF